MADVLEAFCICVPTIQRLFPEPCTVTVANTEKVVAIQKHPKTDIPVEVGDPVVKFRTSVIYQVLAERRRVVERKSKDLFGYPYYAVGEPICDGSGNMIGAISVLMLTEREDTLRQHAQELSALVEELSANADSLSRTAAGVAEANNDISEKAAAAKERIQVVSTVLDFISEVASQTNLLGLNAAIEAARAGDYGRGFAVVADEIRHLAQRSQSASRDIVEKLIDIQQAVERMVVDIEQSSRYTQEQASAVQELAAALNQIAKSAEVLAQLSSERA